MRICPASLVSLILAVLVQPCSLTAEPVAVKYTEGSVRGFLALRTQEGKILAAGDLIQTIHGERVVSRLVFHFKDGSIDDETTVFTQRGHFRLISDHHIQRGPMFPKPTDVLINAITDQVTVRYKDKDQEKVQTDHLDLPPDLANGILLDVLKNLSPDIEETKLSYVVAAPKPRLVELSIKPEGGDTFGIADAPHKSIRFVVKVELGGIVGMVAPLIGKQPANTDVWVSVGQVPALVKLEEPSYNDAPLWSTEAIGPVWRQTTSAKRSDHKSGGL